MNETEKQQKNIKINKICVKIIDFGAQLGGGWGAQSHVSTQSSDFLVILRDFDSKTKTKHQRSNNKNTKRTQNDKKQENKNWKRQKKRKKIQEKNENEREKNANEREKQQRKKKQWTKQKNNRKNRKINKIWVKIIDLGAQLGGGLGGPKSRFH